MALKQVHRGPLSETATVASKLGEPGEVRFDASGNQFKLLKVGSITLQKCAAVQLESTNGTDGYTVAPASIMSLGAIAFQNQINSTQTLGSGVYFWGQQYGVGSVCATATPNVNLRLGVSVSGHLITGGATDNFVARTLASNAVAGTPQLHFINCLGGF